MAEDIRSTPIGTKADRSLAEADRDEQVLRHVQEFPGAHLRHVQRETGLPLGTTTRTLDRLEKEGRVFSETDGAYRRFFPKEGLHKRERVVLGHLAHDRTRAVLQAVLDQPGVRHSQIVQDIGISPATLTYHLKQLVEDEVVLVRDKGRARYFRVKNPDLVSRAMERWRATTVPTPTPVEEPVSAETMIGAGPETTEPAATPTEPRTVDTLIGQRAERTLAEERERRARAAKLRRERDADEDDGEAVVVGGEDDADA